MSFSTVSKVLLHMLHQNTLAPVKIKMPGVGITNIGLVLLPTGY